MLDASRLVSDLYQVHQSISSQLFLLQTQCSSLNELLECRNQDFAEQTDSDLTSHKSAQKIEPKPTLSQADKELQELLSAADILLTKARRVKLKYGISSSSAKHESTTERLAITPTAQQEEEKQPPTDPVKHSFQNNFGNNFPEEFRNELATYWTNIQEEFEPSSLGEESFLAKVASSVPIEKEQTELSVAALHYGLMMAVSELQNKTLELLASYTPGNSEIAKTVVHLHTKTLQQLNLIQQGQPMEGGVMDHMMKSLDVVLQHVENQIKIRKRDAPLQRDQSVEKFAAYHPSKCWLPQSCSALEGLDEMLFAPVKSNNPQSKYMYENVMKDLHNVERFRNEIQWKLLQFHLESQIAETFLPWLGNCSVQSKEDQRFVFTQLINNSRMFLMMYSFVFRMLVSEGSNKTCRFVPRNSK